MGKISVSGDGVTPAWKKICTSANFLVKYTKKETDNALDGNSAMELTKDNYTATTSGGSCSTRSPSELAQAPHVSVYCARGRSTEDTAAVNCM